MLNTSYGFTSYDSYADMNRRAHASDYAKSQGVWVSSRITDNNGNYISYYRLRSAGCNFSDTTGVSDYGIVYCFCNNYGNDYGIRPALCFNPASTVPTHEHTDGHVDSDNDGICDSCGDTMPEVKNCKCVCHKSGFAGFQDLFIK